MHLVFISSILTLRHTSLYPASLGYWPTADPFIRRNDETYTPVGCSSAETLADMHQDFRYFHNNIIAGVARREPNLFVISPLALSLAISLLNSAPFRQDTISNGPRLQQGKCSHEMGLQLFIDYLGGYGSTGLSLADSVFVSAKVNLRPKFIETVTKTFRTGMRRLNFEDTAEREHFIGYWGNGHTKNLVHASTSMALVNVIYYKGEWEQKFDIRNTVSVSSTAEDGKTVISSTMHVMGSFRQGSCRSINGMFIELPLKSQDGEKHVSLFIIIPGFVHRSSPSFDPSHHMLNISIEDLYEYSYVSKHTVSVPKLKIESTIDVRPVVESMMPGNSIFDQQTRNLRLIAESPNLVGDKFVQRTSIEINEDGVEAMTIDDSPDPPPPEPATIRGVDLQTFYVLLATMDAVPQIIFSGRAYRLGKNQMSILDPPPR